MLVQDNSIFPDMSGDGLLRRSSWKAEAIRRGDLKISGPIPITEETPLNDEEEREYAEKHGVDPPLSIPEPTHPPPPPPVPPQQSVAEESIHTATEPDEPITQQEEEHEKPRVHSMVNGAREASPPATKTTPEPVAVTCPSPFPSVQETSPKSTPKKNRKSGLRSVFRRMFSRRSRERSQGGDDNSVHRHTYHRSDPGALTQLPERQEASTGRPRISDLPVRELQPINPLGQHLPFPMNVNAPQQTSPPHEYLTFEVPGQPGRRRATLPSLLLAHNDAKTISAAWGGKSAMSFDERQEHESEQIPSPQIGMAISSPTGAKAPSIASKRRSRSAGALRPSTERRRSEEIRYWRTSYQSGSVYSSNTPRPRTAQTVETVKTIDERDDPVTTTELGVPESRAEEAPTHDVGVEQHDQDISEIPLPVDAFNFGNLRSTFSDEALPQHDEPKPGPDIEQESGVRRRSSQRLSMEERVQNLEDNMRVLEGSVRRISGRSNRQTIILENAPKGRRSSRNRSSSATSEGEVSNYSRKSSNKALSIKQEPTGPPSPTLAPLSAVSEFPSSHDRPQTVIALEPSAMPKPAVSQDPNLNAQFAAMQSALQHERASRKMLEKQVFALQRELSDLHTLVNKFLSTSPSYPTPSPDVITTSNEERLSTPRAVRRPPARGLGFESEDEAPGVLGSGISLAPINTSRMTRETVISRFSQSDSELEADDRVGAEAEMSATSSREDITSPEAWATPKEESGFGSGFFGRRADDEMF